MHPAYKVFLALVVARRAWCEGAHFTNEFHGVAVGHPTELVWEGDGSPVTIVLLNGPATNLQPVREIVTAYAGQGTLIDSYWWTPRLSITAALTGYALKIVQSGFENVTSKFDIHTTIAHAPPTLQPIMLDPETGKLADASSSIGGWEGLHAGALSAGYDGVFIAHTASSESQPYPVANATDSAYGSGTGSGFSSATAFATGVVNVSSSASGSLSPESVAFTVPSSNSSMANVVGTAPYPIANSTRGPFASETSTVSAFGSGYTSLLPSSNVSSGLAPWPTGGYNTSATSVSDNSTEIPLNLSTATTPTADVYTISRSPDTISRSFGTGLPQGSNGSVLNSANLNLSSTTITVLPLSTGEWDTATDLPASLTSLWPAVRSSSSSDFAAAPTGELELGGWAVLGAVVAVVGLL